jgi:hypothetical protein
MTKFLRARHGFNIFEFFCVACEAEGEIEIRTNDRQPFPCPEGCGAVYIQWYADKIPALRCVVWPVFEEEAKP